MSERIMTKDQKATIPCRNCWHPEADHRGSSGPWSDGRYHHGECTHGCETVPHMGELYRFGGCDCSDYQPLHWLSRAIRAITKKERP